jgi:hypothetical protein
MPAIGFCIMYKRDGTVTKFNPLKAELNPICHLLALLDAHLIFHVSSIRVNKKITYDLGFHLRN